MWPRLFRDGEHVRGEALRGGWSRRPVPTPGDRPNVPASASGIARTRDRTSQPTELRVEPLRYILNAFSAMSARNSSRGRVLATWRASSQPRRAWAVPHSTLSHSVR